MVMQHRISTQLTKTVLHDDENNEVSFALGFNERPFLSKYEIF